ncbi:hypothetical protein MRB53_006430 [Persea americana]|uniref:Uncharacterized protein n=1 Tax=Persea americana TaxID=3435 RepID=A0ACC2MG02_PERAE|nr:hypothetical protein MRB53_006430 [Persea americana]
MDHIGKLHAHLIRIGLHRDPSSISTVLTSYALSLPHLKNACLVFNQIEEPTTYIWNSMIRGFSQSNQPKKSIFFYNCMRSQGLGVAQNHLTFLFALKACTRVSEVGEGKKIHVHLMKLGFGSYTFVCNALIHMYALCGDLGSARKVFDEMPERDVVSWNSLICGYSHNNELREVLDLFEEMRAENVKADEVTMVKVVLACTHLGDWKLADSMAKYIEVDGLKVDVYLGNTLIDCYGRRGSVELARRVFDEMAERNMVSWNAMITAYAKAGDLAAAKKLFDEMPNRDVISWTSIIAGYSQSKRFADALSVFRDMMKAEVKPDEITVASVLSACAHLGALDVGKKVHEYICEKNIKEDIYVGNALIDMYCKCGCIEKALEVFDKMRERDTVSWTSVISGLAVNGNAEHALELFSRMLSNGVRPSSVTFIGVLVACSHSGLVEKGLEYFNSMVNVHKIEPQMKHYGCVVDLLSRSGLLDEAYQFIMNMSVAPDPVMWRTLLSACKIHGNVDLAEVAINKLLELNPSNSGNYVLLSNTYAGAERWDDARKAREMMEERDVRKAPGCSSIEDNGTVNEPIAPDGIPVAEGNQAYGG